MKTIFQNITIAIKAETPQEAYQMLSELLSANAIEFNSDTYSTDNNSFHNSTQDLFPKPGGYNYDD